jgi:hypothetical protein
MSATRCVYAVMPTTLEGVLTRARTKSPRTERSAGSGPNRRVPKGVHDDVDGHDLVSSRVQVLSDKGVRMSEEQKILDTRTRAHVSGSISASSDI